MWMFTSTLYPQGSILGTLSDSLTSNPKLFADGTCLFSVTHNINSTVNDLKSDLTKISNWVFQLKMRFNPDPNEQAQEVIFSKKITKTNHPPSYFNQNLVKSSSPHGMVLDTRLDFNSHLKNVQNKVNKTIGLLRKLQTTLPRTSLITIFKFYIRPHLDYGDIIHD